MNQYVEGIKLAARWKKVPGVLYKSPLPGIGDCPYTITRPRPDKYATVESLVSELKLSRRSMEGLLAREAVPYIIHEVPGSVAPTRYYLREVAEDKAERFLSIVDESEIDRSSMYSTEEAVRILGYKGKASLNKMANSGKLHPVRVRIHGGRIANMYSRDEIELCLEFRKNNGRLKDKA